MKALVTITFKNGVLDPEAKAIQNALHSLEFSEVSQVSVSKIITLYFDHKDSQKALEQSKQMAEELLANLVIQDYFIEIEQ